MRNPELLRNIWQSFSMQKIIVPPCIILAILFLVHLSNAPSLSSWAYGLLCLIVIIGGTRSAAFTMCHELNDNTWDWQRTSRMGPSELVIGKLFGGTSYIWYLSLFPLAVMIYARSMPHLLLAICFIVIIALFVQALSLLLSLQAASYSRKIKLTASSLFLIPLILGLYLCWGFLPFSLSAELSQKTMLWYDLHVKVIDFNLISLSIFLLWTLVGLYRSMRQQLQFQNTPWVWAIFIVFILVYFSGVSYGFLHMLETSPNFTNADHFQRVFSHAVSYTCFGLSLFITYIAFLTEDLNLIIYKKMKSSLRAKGLMAALSRMPLWPISLPPLLLFSLVVALLPSTHLGGKIDYSPSILAFSCVIFLTRDLVLVHFIHTFRSTRSPLTWVFIYFAVLYFLIPAILLTGHAGHLAAMFYPSFGLYGSYSLIGGLVQVVIFAGLLFKAYRNLQQA